MVSRKRLANNLSDVLTKEFLLEVHERLEVKEIAQMVGCGCSTIRKYLHKYNLTIKDSRKGKCLASNHGRWKGGKYINDSGYVMVKVATGKYKREHILNIEQFLGRGLYVNERIHHLNGNRVDNRLDNLVVMDKREHDRYHLIMRNKNLDYTNHKACDVMNILYPNLDNKLKMYAELTRIAKV